MSCQGVEELPFERVIAGEYQAAFDDLRPAWPFSPGELDTLLNTTVT
ncbi:MAG: hypothetical protein AVDCRST_MAG86-1581 [uncultured Truepera sp.]|uniref:Uncharacterized protein n=1 Tax=uncultured Truepera sp. TaxID=543023 RepID=A0A6J4V9P4_9DEIN|nr:MAG: hypothetical protein AVDCRST_MAG86-1581 [uncultured Truepera sp.]